MKNVLKSLTEPFLLFLFTLVSIIIRGYEFGLGNQIHYLTYLNYALNPSLYPFDYLLKTHTIPYTIFIDFLRVIPGIVHYEQGVIFTLYFIFLYFFYWSILHITKILFHDTKFSWFTLPFFIFQIPIGGSTIFTVENTLITRFIADVFLLVSLYFLLIKKPIVSGILAGIGFLFHPLTMLVYPVIAFFLWIYKHLSFKKMIISLEFFLVIIIPLLGKFFTKDHTISPWIDATWKKLITERLPYIFVLHWSLFDLFFVLLMPVFLFYFYKVAKILPKIHPFISSVAITSLSFFAFSILSSFTSYRLGIQLQLGRNLYLLVILVIMLFLRFLYSKKGFFYPVALILFLLLFVTLIPQRLTDGILWYRPLSDFEKTAVWAQNNTSIKSIFVVPSESSGFRMWSKRSVVVENKEGGDGLYDRSFGLTWDKREDAAAGKKLTVKNIPSLEKEFHMNYVVTTNSLPYPIVFTSGNWKIYRIT